MNTRDPRFAKKCYFFYIYIYGTTGYFFLAAIILIQFFAEKKLIEFAKILKRLMDK